MKESIFFASIRAFFISIFAVLGITFGLILMILIFGSFSDTSLADLDYTYKKETVANAEGKRKPLSKELPTILKVNIEGVIGTDQLSTSDIKKMLVESREGDLKDNRVKAILLSINTPGGTVLDADGIYRAIKHYKTQYKVPVYAYVDGLCASGGMYVASAADKIFATNVSLIGSVGVISPAFFNITGLIDKIGIQALTLSAGKDKDILNPLRTWKEDEPKIVQSLIDYYYNRFVDIVVENRPNINRQKLIDDYGAKIFNPIEAADFGFINASGYSYETVLQELLKEIGIQDESYQVVEMQKKAWYSQLFNAKWDFSGYPKVVHQIQIHSDLDPKLQNQFLYMYLPQKI